MSNRKSRIHNLISEHEVRILGDIELVGEDNGIEYLNVQFIGKNINYPKHSKFPNYVTAEYPIREGDLAQAIRNWVLHSVLPAEHDWSKFAQPIEEVS